jgi:hypothetical protein
MSRHLVEWLLENPIELPEVPNVGSDRAWRVLMSLANRAHENTGKMTASDRTQERDTGLERRGVIQPVRKALEQAGWLVDTGKREAKGVKVYELTVPGYSRPVSSGEVSLATKTVDNKPSGVVSGVVSGVGSGEVSLAQTKQNKTSLSKSQNDSESQTLKKQREEILSLCIELETRAEQSKGREVGAAFVSHWRKDYRPIIAQALESPTDQNPAQIAQQCYNQRHGVTKRHSVPQAQALPSGHSDCPTCAGEGLLQTWNEAEMRLVPTWCACTGKTTNTPTQEPTTKRVSTNEGANTDIPVPSAKADPQSAIRDLTKRLRVV